MNTPWKFTFRFGHTKEVLEWTIHAYSRDEAYCIFWQNYGYHNVVLIDCSLNVPQSRYDLKLFLTYRQGVRGKRLQSLVKRNPSRKEQGAPCYQ